jgi:hypothetical protein
MSEWPERGDRVEESYYGVGTIRYLSGDLMPDGSGRYYDWPGQVCVEFDREIDGEKPCCWIQIGELRRV